MFSDKYSNRIKDYFSSYSVIIHVLLTIIERFIPIFNIFFFYFGNILLFIPFYFKNKLLFATTILFALTLDISGQILPIKILGSLGDFIYMINKLFFCTIIIIVLLLIWLYVKDDEKKYDILSIVEHKHNKVYGINKSLEIIEHLKKHSINCDIQLVHYGYEINRYSIGNFNCKIHRLIACISLQYPNRKILVNNDALLLDLPIEYNNCITLRDYLDLLQVDNLIFLKTNNKILVVKKNRALFIDNHLFIKILGLLLLSISKNKIFIVNNNVNNEFLESYINIYDLKSFIKIFDKISNHNNFKREKSCKYYVLLFIDDYISEYVQYILKYASDNGFFVILFGKNNIYNIEQYIEYSNNIYTYKYKFFQETINLPRVTKQQIIELYEFLKYQNININ